MNNTQWRDLVGRLLKTEMSKKKLRYDDLSQLLEAQGIHQTAANLRNKINRGILGADLLLQLIFVMNIKTISHEDLLTLIEEME